MADEFGINIPGGDETDLIVTPGEGFGVGLQGGPDTDPIIPITPEPRSPTKPGPTGPTGPVEPTEPTGPTEPTAPEPVPEPVAPLGGLPDLGWLAMLLVVLGLIGLAAALVDFFNWLLRAALSRIPGGSKVQPFTTQILTQPLSNALGNAYTGIDGQIGLSFTTMGQVANRVGLAILEAEQAIYIIAVKLAALAGNTTGVHAKAVTALAHARQAQITGTQAQAQATVEKQRAVTSEHRINARITTQTQHLTHLIEPELETLRHRITHLERGATVTWDEIRKHEGLLGISAMTATTAVALSKLGADWIECESTKTLGRQLCGTAGNSLGRLLRGGLPLLAFGDICTTLRGASALMQSGAVQGSLSLGADGVAGLLGCTGAEGAAPLHTAYYSPGPRTAIGAPGAIASQV